MTPKQARRESGREAESWHPAAEDECKDEEMTFDADNARGNVYLDGEKLARCLKITVDDSLASKIVSEPVPARCLIGFTPALSRQDPMPPDAIEYEGMWAHWIEGAVQIRR